MRISLLAPLALVVGCNVVDAPDELEELVVFGFIHFDGEEELPVAAVEGLIPFTRTNLDELDVGYRVDNLTRENLEAAGATPADDEIDIMGVSASVLMSSDLADIGWVLTYEDMTEVQEVVISWDVEAVGDRDCFVAQECGVYEISGSRTNSMGIFGESVQSFSKEWRWVDVDGELVLTQREKAPEPAEMATTLFELDQQYAYSLFFAEDGGTRRLETLWVDARAIGMDVPDTFALDMAVNTMRKNAEQLDEFIAANR